MLRRLVSVLALGVVAFALLPSTASADAVAIPTTADARIDGFRAAGAPGPEGVISEPVQAPITFGLVGFTLPAGTGSEFRTSLDGERWDVWTALELLSEADEGPDERSAEAAAAGDVWEQMSEAVWVGEARWLQVRIRGGDIGDVVAHLVDSQGLSASFGRRVWDAVRSAVRGASAPPAAAQESQPGAPRFVTRAEWGADESMRRRGPRYITPRAAVVHHTAETNAYAPEEGPAVIRAMYHFHTQVRGWSDIGYNILIDRYGVVYEGRAGGLHRGVEGSHARGFNDATFGVSIMGNFNEQSPPPVAVEALARVIAWKFDLHGIDVFGTVPLISGGSTLHPLGAFLELPTVFGHGNVAISECPGEFLEPLLPVIRQRVVELGPRFVDVSPVARETIQPLVDLGVIAGCEERRFCPDRPVTRAQVATLLARATHLPAAEGDLFADAAGSPHSGAINALAHQGVVRGCEDGRFCPDQPVTRGQLATLMVRAFDDLKPHTRAMFTDIARSPHRTAINGLADGGVAKGCRGTRFCPDAPVTRGQIAVFLARAIGAA